MREHDVGAEVGQQLGAVRARDAVRAVDDAQPVVDHASRPSNIGTTTDRPGTVGNVSGRNVTRTGCVGDELVGRGVDEVGAEPHRRIFGERDERGDERHRSRERGQERAPHDRPREQRAASPDTAVHVSAPVAARALAPAGTTRTRPHASQRVIISSPRAAPAKNGAVSGSSTSGSGKSARLIATASVTDPS